MTWIAQFIGVLIGSTIKAVGPDLIAAAIKKYFADSAEISAPNQTAQDELARLIKNIPPASGTVKGDAK